MEKYEQSFCIKCKISTIFDGSNAVAINNEPKGVLCEKCERTIFGGEQKKRKRLEGE